MIAMALSAVGMSFSGLILREMDMATPSQINIYRNIAFLFMVFGFYFCRSEHKNILSGFNFSLPVLGPAISLAITGITIVQALTYTSIASAMFIMGTVPFISMGLAYIFLGEAISKLTFACMMIALGGIILMFNTGDISGSLYGNVMAIAAAVSFSSFAVFVRGNNTTDLVPSLIIAALIIVAVSFFSASGQLSISRNDLILCIIWGAGLSGTSHLIFIYAASYIKAAELTLFGLLETALAPIWVWILIAESPGGNVIFGGVAVISAIMIKTIFEVKQSASL